jgi:ABC-type phosphate transport system permease subunit
VKQLSPTVGEQRPSPQLSHVPQSISQLMHVSAPSQIESPQNPVVSLVGSTVVIVPTVIVLTVVIVPTVMSVSLLVLDSVSSPERVYAKSVRPQAVARTAITNATRSDPSEDPRMHITAPPRTRAPDFTS